MRAMTLGAVLLPWIAQLHAPICAAAPPGKKQPVSSLKEVTVMLSSAEVDEVRSALERAALLPPKQVMPVVFARVRAGLPPMLLDVAIDTLILLNDPAAGPLLDDLARHRRSAVRRRALDAAAQLRVRGAEPLLARGLDDLSPEVRSAAVEGLGEVAARGSFAQVLRALEMGVEGSALSLGKITDSAHLDSALGLIGEHPLETLTPMVETLLMRRDLSEDDKLKVVERLAEVSTEPLRKLLSELLAKLPREASPKLRKAMTDVAESQTKGAS